MEYLLLREKYKGELILLCHQITYSPKRFKKNSDYTKHEYNCVRFSENELTKVLINVKMHL